jgi:membrane protein implicated in regulation of membrane protease activity
MKLNVGGLDRMARIAIGLVLVGLAASGSVGAWAWLGVIPLATGAIGWCPPYAIFGWSTCSLKQQATKKGNV